MVISLFASLTDFAATLLRNIGDLPVRSMFDSWPLRWYFASDALLKISIQSVVWVLVKMFFYTDYMKTDVSLISKYRKQLHGRAGW